MKFWKVQGRDNLEETILAVRPNCVIAVKPAGDQSKILIQNFQHWVLVDREFNELLKELENVDLRSKVRKVQKEN